MTMYIGVDVGKERRRAAFMNPKGTIEKEFFFKNNHKGITHLTSQLTSED